MSKISVSQAAQDYLRTIIEKQKMPGLAIRLSVTNPGTPGVETGILYCPREYITTNDLHFKMDGFEIVVDLNVKGSDRLLYRALRQPILSRPRWCSTLS